MAAAKIDPLHLRQPLTKLLLNGRQRCGQRIGVLLTQRMKMQAIHQIHHIRL